MVETQVVREQVRDQRLEAVEAREHVVADRENDVDAKSGTGHDLGELCRKAVVVCVVEEVLVELVEDEIEIAAERARPGCERRGEPLLGLIDDRVRERRSERLPHLGDQARDRVPAPRAEDDNCFPLPA